MTPEEFRLFGHQAIDWIAEYLAHPERYPVLPPVKPGQLTDALPARGPERGEPMSAILADFERLIVPATTRPLRRTVICTGVVARHPSVGLPAQRCAETLSIVDLTVAGRPSTARMRSPLIATAPFSITWRCASMVIT